MRIVHFELLQLYRNYKNIESINVDVGDDEAIVFGHFDLIRFKNADSAENALDILYNEYSDINDSLKKASDIQPIILFSYDNKRIACNNNKCMVISFMQIERPAHCDSIKKFYAYSVNKIQDTIEKVKQSGAIGNVEADVYIPLSFMNAAVVFYADNFTDICIIMKNIIANKLASYQYSVLYLSKGINFEEIQPTKDINVSLRFIWKEHGRSQQSVKLLEDVLRKLNVENFSISHLMGNNDCLLTVPENGYRIVNILLNSDTDFSKFKENVENIRISINFPQKDVGIVDLKENFENQLSYKICDEDITAKENELINSLKSLKDELSNLEKSDVNDIIYRVFEFGKFMNVIKKHAIKGIATPLYLSMIKPYSLFLEIAIEKVSEIEKVYRKEEVLQVIGNVMNDMLSYYGNIFHSNLGFFEERGFYNNIIGLASNVELAYNKYANLVCSAIKSDDEQHCEETKICCAVTADKEPMICTSDIFWNIKDPETDNRALLNINVPVSYVFKYNKVSSIIIHEVAHYVGCRNRKKRAEVLSKVIASIISDTIYQSGILSLRPKAKNAAITIFENYENTDAYKTMHDQMCSNVFDAVSSCFTKKVMARCNNSYYMNTTVNAIIDSLNNICKDEELVNTIVDELVEFKFWYYECFEDFYLEQNSNSEKMKDVMVQISDYAIKEYNRNFVKKSLIDVLSELVYDLDGSDVDGLSEKNCNIYVPDICELIDNLYNAVTEAYCDIMMVTLTEVEFSDYMDLMEEYGKGTAKIISDNDYMTWLRVNFVSKYMNSNIDISYDELPERFKYFYDVNIVDSMFEYFDSLRPEFNKALERSKKDKVLSEYLSSIVKNDEKNCFKAIYDMLFSIKPE